MHFLLGLLRSLSFGSLRSEPHKQYSFTRFCACRMNCCKPISVSLAVKCRQQLINVLHRITITPISTEQAQVGAAELTSSVYRSQNSSVKLETESPTCMYLTSQFPNPRTLFCGCSVATPASEIPIPRPAKPPNRRLKKQFFFYFFLVCEVNKKNTRKEKILFGLRPAARLLLLYNKWWSI
jgi:hypothetical protein